MTVAHRGGHGRGGAQSGEKPKNMGKTFRRLVRYMGDWTWGLIIAVVLSVVATVFRIVTPRVLGRITTIIFEGIQNGLQAIEDSERFLIDFEAIVQVLIVVAGLYIVTALFQFGQNFILTRVTQRIVEKLRSDTRHKLNRIPLAFVDTTPTGEILSRAINDVENIGANLQQLVSLSIMSLTMLVATIVMMFVISPTMTLISFVLIALSLVVVSWIAPYTQTLFSRQQAIQGELNTQVEENISGITENQAFGQEVNKIQAFSQKSDEYYEVSWQAQFISNMIRPIISVINNIGYILVGVIGAMFVLDGRLPIGDVQAMIQYSTSLTFPITQIATMINQMQSLLASAERVFEYLDEEEEQDVPVDVPEVASDAKVIFDGVEFGYEHGEVNRIIKDFSLSVYPGQTIAIVGPTGSGKTTLINLLERFYDIDRGSIKIDGIDIRNQAREVVRANMAMVLQDTWLFNGTIHDNIAYGKAGEATEAEVLRAAKLAYVDEFVQTLPQGYQTIINEDTSNISQGQRQLITIARAFVSDPDILILDEATSSVDTRTEMLIQQAMQRLLGGRTSFVIAHRLSTIQNADQIIVLQDGRMIEKGTHQELLDQHGFYHNLYYSQFEVGNG